MAFTRIFRGPSSLASDRVMASTAAFVALHTEVLAGVSVLTPEPILLMCWFLMSVCARPSRSGSR
jgi:hypothetical protein